MSSLNANAPGFSDSPELGDPIHYQVVARRYRPNTFDELVGQEHIAQALKSAVQTGRVGHAYLFAGARGVGKTSTARILAKALNCEKGPTPTPCNQCSLCQEIAVGGALDVLEIDGASNRGIEEVRALRQNATLRPSRARYKIYIIDEVHMLTREAFNALLKTLEEPPPHVKFIFCTTEPNKIPPTILSRCQRFDFAGISAAAICRRLEQILEKEGISGEPEALEILARRAGGSMRDAQSMLEQVLAFGSGAVTTATVRELLGLSSEEILGTLAELAARGDAAGALSTLDRAIAEGADLAIIIEQLAGYYRDLMVVAAGCGAEMLQFTTREELPRLQRLAHQYGLETILAALQILDHTLQRMRFSFQPRIVAELGLTRLARLNYLVAIPEILARLEGGQVAKTHGILTPVGDRPSHGTIATRSPGATAVANSGTLAPPSQAITNRAPISAEPAVNNAGELGDQVSVEASPPVEASWSSEALSPRELAGRLRQEIENRCAQQTVAEGTSSPKIQVEPGGSRSPSGRGRKVSGGKVAQESTTRESSKLTPPYPGDSNTSWRGGSSGPAEEGPSPLAEPRECEREWEPASLWQSAVERLGGYTATLIRDPLEVRWKSPNCLFVLFPPGQYIAKGTAQRAAPQLEGILAELTRRTVRVEVAVEGNSRNSVGNSDEGRESSASLSANPNAISWRTHPLVRKAAEIFDALPSPPKSVSPRHERE